LIRYMSREKNRVFLSGEGCSEAPYHVNKAVDTSVVNRENCPNESHHMESTTAGVKTMRVTIKS
jgi:hypothetical protein